MTRRSGRCHAVSGEGEPEREGRGLDAVVGHVVFLRSRSAVETRPNARDEVWIPIVFIVLLALCFEWALYHRDTVLRGWRALTGRLRRGSPAGGG